MAAGEFNCPLVVASVVLYTNDIGWSSAKFVPRLVLPDGIVVTPPKLIREGWLYTLPNAIVPS